MWFLEFISKIRKTWNKKSYDNYVQTSFALCNTIIICVWHIFPQKAIFRLHPRPVPYIFEIQITVLNKNALRNGHHQWSLPCLPIYLIQVSGGQHSANLGELNRKQCQRLNDEQAKLLQTFASVPACKRQTASEKYKFRSIAYSSFTPTRIYTNLYFQDCLKRKIHKKWQGFDIHKQK